MRLHERASITLCLAALAWAWACSAEPVKHSAGSQAAPAAEGASPAATAADSAPAPVDEMPKAIRQVPPKYPEGARKQGLTGTVYVRALVSKAGKVSRVEVPPGKGVSTDLDQAATTAVRRWVFKPAQLKGRPKEAWVIIPVRFELK